MTKFFVSYSRSVKDEVGKVITLLRASGHEVWWDGDIPVMADWWATILKHIEWCEVFIFVASEQSVQSAYCIAELKYANERNRPILPFMLDDAVRYTLPEALPHRNQWLMYDGDSAHMLAAIDNASKLIEWAKHRDIRAPRPPEPLKEGRSLAQKFQEARRLANARKFEEAKRRFRNIKELDYGEWGSECDEWLARLNSYISIMELVNDESTLKRARAAWDQHSHSYGTDFDPHGIEAKLKGQESPARRPRAAMVVGIVMVVFIGVMGAAFILLSGNNPPTVTPERLELTPVEHNADWRVIERDFDGVTMMLVPVGCFEMGSRDGGSVVTPVEWVCFDEPFWIDRTEVTQAQFRQFRGVKAGSNFYSGDQRPVERISWFEARDFCALRNGRLPTEAEWEYAARGPDGLAYPWGNTFDANKAVFNSNSGTAEVGSRPEGASWVGALDMSGNVIEWTSSLMLPYPYGDVHESDGDTSSERIWRGGSYYNVEAPQLAGFNRAGYYPDSAYAHVGFRCVRSDT